MSKHVRKDNLVWGIILIAVGVIFLLGTFDIDVWDTVARLWPIVLIIWGAWKLYYGIKERGEEPQPPKADPSSGHES